MNRRTIGTIFGRTYAELLEVFLKGVWVGRRMSIIRSRFGIRALMRRPNPPFFYGWIILSVVLLAQFISGPGQTHSVSVFVEPMKDSLNLSSGMISALYTAGTLTAAATTFFIGLILDRFGARVVLSGVAMVFGLAVIGMGQVHNEIQLYFAVALLRTFGQGAMILVPPTLLAIWFVKKRGKVMAIAGLGMVASQAIFPPLNDFLINRYDWRDAWLILGITILLVLAIPSITLVRRSPESMGLSPDGDGPEERRSERKTVDEPQWTLNQALRTRALWLLVIANLSIPICFNALIFHNESIIVGRGLDPRLAALVLSTMAPLVLLGNVIAGLLCDRIPSRFVLSIGQGTIGLSILWILFIVSEPWQAFVYGGLIGLAIGINMTTNNVIWANYFGRAHLGSIRGVATAAMVTSSAIGPLPFGVLSDLMHSHDIALLALVILPGFSVLASLCAVPPVRKIVMKS